ncbi:MAG: DNA-directed RNA polymerase subunit alpha [Armatimonadota bacterium]|nr:DNA-directed RNA polymerase subunit alpha [Armatimonadota bacterium]
MTSEIQQLQSTDTYGKFILTPLERGFGQTIGNSLRRVLLGSIPGAAITALRVDKVLHEFAAIPGVKEDMTEFILNLREVAIRVNTPTPPTEDVELTINVKGKGRVTGADIECPEYMEIINPEVYLCTISEARTTFSVELFVSWGKGYVLPNKQDRYVGTIGLIPLGSQFTPVKKVNHTVEATRVGQRTDFERLTLDVWTSGAVTPAAAVSQAAQILMNELKPFIELGAGGMEISFEDEAEAEGDSSGLPDTPLEELDLSLRTLNALRRSQVGSLREILKYTESELSSLKGFGAVAMDEVREKLLERGLSLKPGKGGRTINLDNDDLDDELL